MSVTTSSQLPTDIAGRIIRPGDPAYDQARQILSGAYDRHPAVIVRPKDADDVARVVRFARDTGSELAVRAGGHSNLGHSSTDGGIVLDLRDMNALEIDAGARTAWAQGGLTAGAVTSQLAEHGFAIPFGDTGSVGIGGLTLGGGVGYLVRKHGMAIDNLLAAEIVTADGELLRVDAEHHPDLFWAIRGGGGNFGVVTRFQFRLQPLDGIVGGMLVLPATPDTIAGFISAADAAPEELSTIANVMSAPPMPFLPEAAHGRVVILAMLAYSGDAADADRVLAPFRALAEPLADMLRPMSYPEMFPPEDPNYHPTAAATTMFVDRVDADVAATMLRFLESSDAPMRVAQLRVLGGAMARVPADATAFAHRSSPIMVNLAAFYGPDDRSEREAWVAEFAAALDQGRSGAYVNFLTDEGPDSLRAAYPGATFDRLASVKARYDPTNLFRLNQNVPPMAAGSA